MVLTLPLASTAQLSDFDPAWSPIGPYTAAETCANCHSASPLGSSPALLRAPLATDPSTPDPQGEDISPINGQQTSIMGHSLDDPYFQAVVEDETYHFPALAGLIEDTCLTCHAPMGHDYAHSYDPTRLDADGYYRMDQAFLDMHAREGISCTLCHQATTDPLGELANGAYQVSGDKLLFGPYADPSRTNMAGYTVQFSTTIQQSELCGTCHNLYTTVLDAETGQPTGERFLEQAAWFEWRNSDFGGPVDDPARVECQQCHMRAPDPSYRTKIADRGGAPERADYSPHRMMGGNTHMLQILSSYADFLGLDDRLTVERLGEAETRTRAFLREAARLGLSTSVDGETLTVDVLIENLTGHKLPAGFPSRRMWLELTVTDGGGELLFQSGVPDAQGRLASDIAHTASACLALVKPEGFDNSACFEAHRDQITDAGQTAVFESVMADTHGDITYLLLHAHSYLKDNRIPPAGFLESGPDFIPETASVGIGADADFNAGGSGSDTVHYAVDVGAAGGPFTISARLLYQSIRPAFVDGMLSGASRVTQFKDQYGAIPPPVELIDEASTIQSSGELVFRDGFESGG